MTRQPKITRRQFDAMIRGRKTIAINAGKARLTVAGSHPDRRFVMTGPSGTHSLLVVATDLSRLNGHWSVFASAEANRATA